MSEEGLGSSRFYMTGSYLDAINFKPSFLTNPFLLVPAHQSSVLSAANL
jgi:hypothetical protein